MERFQDNKTANSSCRSTASQQSSRTYLGEFMDRLEKYDTVDEEIKHNIILLLHKQEVLFAFLANLLSASQRDCSIETVFE